MSQKQVTIDSFSILDTAKEIHLHGKGGYGISHIEPFKPLLFLLFICLVPVVLIRLNIVPFEYRFHAFFCALSGLGYFIFHRRYSLIELGFRTDNLKSSLAWNLLFCAIGGIGLLMMHRAGFVRSEQSYLPSVYLVYILFLGPVQEIVFRGILFAEIKRVQSPGNLFFLLISTLSFCLLHIIYNHPPLLVIALISGLAWGIIFIKQPNIWGIALSHSLLGALAMLLGLI